MSSKDKLAAERARQAAAELAAQRRRAAEKAAEREEAERRARTIRVEARRTDRES